MSRADRWKTIERIYQEVVDRPESDRAAFLDSACRGDSSLRREVESLLAHEGPSLLDRSALDVAAANMTRPVTRSWAGQTLGNYEISALVGAGGMGEVYRARDRALGREVALKLLPRHVSADPERVRRLDREARLLASLTHSRIAVLYGLEQCDGQRFLVMELVRGDTLADRLRRGALSLVDALEVCRQIAEGLEAAHEAGIVHRDLKPSNVKLTPAGDVKLLDFGLAKVFQTATEREALTPEVDEPTREGTVLGTPAYMSPEQARGQSVDRRTDIWAFGCCLFECLTGRSAFKGDTVSDTLAAVLDKDPDWSAMPPRVPSGVRRVIRRCLVKDVRHRLQHIGDARLELEDTGLEAGEITERTHGALRGRWPLAIVAVVMAVVAATAWLVGRSPTRAAARPVVRLTLTLQDASDQRVDLQVNRFFIPFAISPDGERIVFRARVDLQSGLFIRELAGFQVTPLPGTEYATTPFFSPDGRWVGFWRAEDRMLRKVPIAGGAPIELASIAAPHVALWGPNDEIVVDPAASLPLRGAIWTLSAAGGEAPPASQVPYPAGHGERISPRAFVAGSNDLLLASNGPEGRWLGVLSRQTGELRRLVRGGANAVARVTPTHHLVYAEGDTLFAVPVDRRLAPVGPAVPAIHGIDHYFWHSNVALSDTGTVVYLPSERTREAELAWVDLEGHVTPVPGGRSSFYTVALSPNGREAAAAAIADGVAGQLWILDLERGTRRLLPTANRSCWSPMWSRDGTYLTYQCNDADEMLCRRRADGTGPEECPIHHAGYPEPSDWSPDGRFLLFNSYTTRGDADVFMYSSGRTLPLLATTASESEAKFSPDGRFIAFQADDGGVSHVYLQPFPGPGPRTTVSMYEGGGPQWAPDGRHLYYSSGRRVMAVDVRTSPNLWIGESKVLLELRDPWRQIALTPDVKRLLVMSPRAMDGPPELRVVLNWFDDLERIAPHPRY